LPQDSKHWDITGNLLIKGDNLDALRLLRQSYFGQVKLIYIDPPYNTQSDAFVYRDNFTARQSEVLAQLGYAADNIDCIKKYLRRPHPQRLALVHVPQLWLCHHQRGTTSGAVPRGGDQGLRQFARRERTRALENRERQTLLQRVETGWHTRAFQNQDQQRIVGTTHRPDRPFAAARLPMKTPTELAPDGEITDDKKICKSARRWGFGGGC
jgi:hypothetical protein